MFDIERKQLEKMIDRYPARSATEASIIHVFKWRYERAETAEDFAYLSDTADFERFVRDADLKPLTKKATQRLQKLFWHDLYYTAWEMAHLEDMPPRERDQYISDHPDFGLRWEFAYEEFCEQRQREREEA